MIGLTKASEPRIATRAELEMSETQKTVRSERGFDTSAWPNGHQLL